MTALAGFVGDLTALILSSQRRAYTAEEIHGEVLRIAENHKQQIEGVLMPNESDKLRAWAAMAREAIPALPTITDPELRAKAEDASCDLLHRIALFVTEDLA